MTTYDLWLAAACLILLAVVAVLSLFDDRPRDVPPRLLPECTDDPTAYGDEFWDVVDEELTDVQVTFALVLSGIDPEEER